MKLKLYFFTQVQGNCLTGKKYSNLVDDFIAKQGLEYLNKIFLQLRKVDIGSFGQEKKIKKIMASRMSGEGLSKVKV
jgi:hypothetical protein